MKFYKTITLLLMSAVIVIGCNDFGNMNVSPNSASEARPELLLASAQKTVSSISGATTGALYVQYLTELQYNDASVYSNEVFDFNGWYTGALNNLETIITLNTDSDTKEDALTGGSNENQIAVARIMKAYYFMHLTDRWGAIPYSEALKGRENLSPSYDTQEAIYKDLVKELKEAATQINVGSAGVTGDILFGGDMDTWRRFANSLRARIAMRMALVEPALAETEYKDARDSDLIETDLFYTYLEEAANQNPWYARFITRVDYSISTQLADDMIAYGDYRVTRFADPAASLDDGDGETTFAEIVGFDYGNNKTNPVREDVSLPGQAIRAQGAPLPIITVAEMKLAEVEAIERGWISGNAEEIYKEAIEASWSQWDVYDADNIDDYMNNPEIAYDSANWIEKVGYQKYVALFPEGYEAWSEWRRLGVPNLVPHPYALNPSGQIPLRQKYPTTEPQINEDNYNAAVSQQGPDDSQTKLWWDVN